MTNPYFWLEIVCDTCSDSGPGLRTNHPQKHTKDLIKEAKERGWLLKGEEAYCLRCKGEQNDK